MKIKKSPSFRIFLSVIVISIVIEITAIVVNTVQAQSTPTPSDDQVNIVASQLFCPVCKNVTLDICASSECAQWRGLIREKLAQGNTPEQIKEYFVQQYGDNVLVMPSRTGFNWILYLLPPMLILPSILFTVYYIFTHQAPRHTVKKEHRNE